MIGSITNLTINRALRLGIVVVSMGAFNISSSGDCRIASGTVANCPFASMRLPEALICEDNTSDPTFRTAATLQVSVSGNSVTLSCSPYLWTGIANSTRVSLHSAGRVFAF